LCVGITKSFIIPLAVASTVESEVTNGVVVVDVVVVVAVIVVVDVVSVVVCRTANHTFFCVG